MSPPKMMNYVSLKLHLTANQGFSVFGLEDDTAGKFVPSSSSPSSSSPCLKKRVRKLASLPLCRIAG
jgi:hypothetical protein